MTDQPFYSQRPCYTFSVPGRSYSGINSSIVVNDIDQNGFKDVIVASASGTWIALYKNTNQVFSETILRTPAGSGGTMLSLRDYDDDGDLDIIAGRPYYLPPEVPDYPFLKIMEAGFLALNISD